ncbi:DUF922 domain-containing protein [Aquimarina macrocephali]|uniref:DUF922 domain-containing protein n=1 Tax=Aquimarina macrocephali TaxID=666563 RepID=UPI00046510DA|nr:DUF922 domain-containing protein [Aquimarina macrocephali]
MRYFIIILSLISCSSFAQNVIIENDSLILWQKDRKLTWDDFKGIKHQPKDVHLIHQVAACGIEFKESFFQKTPEDLPVVDVKLYFNKYRGWTITNDIKILEHEQIHFDIAELHTRKIRKKVFDLKTKEILNIYEYVNIVDSIFKECDTYQDKYDDEVLLNHDRQQEWKHLIYKELEELKEYEYIPNNE